jgi:hypothetical protein
VSGHRNFHKAEAFCGEANGIESRFLGVCRGQELLRKKEMEKYHIYAHKNTL